MVAHSRTLRLLLVEDDLEDEELLSQALIEIEEHRQWCNWRTSSIVHVEQLADALDCLRQEWFDVILLNLSLPDSPVLLDSFLEANACAQGAPIVVLADEEDENLANRLLREGAQDVLLKSELECTPLARSLRYAVERQRRTETLRSAPLVDDLTGALTSLAFLTIAGHYAQLARHSRTSLLMGSLEISGFEENTQVDGEARELLLIRAAEVLRAAFEAPTLIGRIGPARFGLVTSGLTETAVEAMLNRVASEIEDSALGGVNHPARARCSVAELDPETNLEEILGENGDEFDAKTRWRTKTVMLAD
jgi:PleD family two-component response regulator